MKNEVSSFQPDLIILDIFLAAEDGRNVCKELKEDKETLHILILVFSASPESLKDYESYCADGVIEKPFNLNQLIEKLTSVLHLPKGETIFN
ncbi:MAG TPA: response regulator [Chitinophagaceae bacterium]|nr:response regulator [Chitinophagaceae bacterium]